MKHYLRIGLMGIGITFALNSLAAEDISASDVINKALQDPNGKVQVTNNNYKVYPENSNNIQTDSYNTQSSATQKTLVTTTFSIDSPKQHELMVNSAIKISGKAPAGVLVSIMLTEEDLYNQSIQHQSLVNISGTTTTDKNGDWIYVPQIQFVPGEYAVTANYKDDQKGNLSSEKIYFTLSDNIGKVKWENTTHIWWWVLGFGFILISILFIFWILRKKQLFTSIDAMAVNAAQVNSNNDEEMEKSVKEVEKDLLMVSREINSAMSEINDLREDIENIDKKKKANKRVISSQTIKLEQELLATAQIVNDGIEEISTLREKVRKNK